MLLKIPRGYLFGGVFSLRHREKLVMAQLHIAEADEDAVCNSAGPNLRVSKRAKLDLIEIRLYVQQQTGPRHEIHL